jgi:predicted  nucleic acid-binding Zn-ribbon protein
MLTVLRKLHVCPKCLLVYARPSLYQLPGCSVCGTRLVVLGFVATQDDLDDEHVCSDG